MTEVFLALLVVAWAVALGPAIVRAGRSTPLTSAERFKRRMSLIAPGPVTGRWVLVPEVRDEFARAAQRRERRRRRRIFAAMSVVAVASGAAAVVTGDAAMVAVHVAVDLSIVVYIYLLHRAERARARSRRRIRARRRVQARRPRPAGRSLEAAGRRA